MKRFACIIVGLLLCAPAQAQVNGQGVVPGHLSMTGCGTAPKPCFIPSALVQPLGYQQITDLSSATGLTVPTGATTAVIVAEAQSVRWRDDGTAPTASVGMVLSANAPLVYTGSLAALSFIRTASGAILNVSFYK